MTTMQLTKSGIAMKKLRGDPGSEGQRRKR